LPLSLHPDVSPDPTLTLLPDSFDRPELSLSELLFALARSRRMIAWSVLIAALSATVVAFLLPVEFTAEAVIMTPQEAESSLSSMAQAAGGGAGGALAGFGLLSAFGLRNPSDLYVGILESRTIADFLIDRFHLLQVYGYKTKQQARKRLKKNTTIRAGKDTLIHILVQDRDPQRAAAMANTYLEQLGLRNSRAALSEASHRRSFFESQLLKEKDLLADAEVALKNTQQKTGLLVPTQQAEVMLRSAAQLHTEILTREAQLSAMKTYVSDQNPRYQAVQKQLATLQSELASLQKGDQSDDSDLPVRKLPQAGLEYLRKYREVKYHELLYEALAKQFEAARLDEARTAPSLQIVDSAVTPERKSWPPRALIVAGSSFLALFCSSVLALYRAGRPSLP
jgi:tyrosine-protein kinase Etk/Wzc